MTFEEFCSVLAPLGIDGRSIPIDDLPRVNRRADGHMELVVTAFARDSEGNRYLDQDTRRPATETHRLTIDSLAVSHLPVAVQA